MTATQTQADWRSFATPTMEAWQIKCLDAGEDLYEYLKDARYTRGLGRGAIAAELAARAKANGHPKLRVSASTVQTVLDRLGIRVMRGKIPAPPI